jgi:proline iminopeptidase
MHSFQSQLVELDDTTIEVLEAGQGPLTIVCTHPYGDTSGEHPNGQLTQALADIGRTFYVVPRGTGRSAPEADPRKLGMFQTVDDMEAVRVALGVERWVASGMSTGAMTAIEYALRYPAATSGVIAIGGAASWHFLEDPNCLYNPAHPEAWREEEARNALDGSDEAGAHWLRTVLELSLQRTELVDSLVAASAISGPRLAAVRDELIGAWDREAELGQIEVPVLIGVGRHDTQCPIAASELMAARIPAATLAVFEDSNHFPYEEEPEAFRAAIRQFSTRFAA